MLKASASILFERGVKMIYYNIDESDYIFEYNKLKFYFSSKFYLEKFERLYVNFIKSETMKLKLRYKCTIICDEMILLLLYKNIEKRGFKVLYKNLQIKENYYVDLKIDGNSFKE